MRDIDTVGVGETVSRHFLRRTARSAARRLNRAHPDKHFTVESYVRGPFGWRVARDR